MPQAPVSRARARGSRTAELVAVSRARHLLKHNRPYVFEDPYAIHFVGDLWRRVLGSRVLDALFSKVLVKKLMPITTQHLTRARFAEECLEESARNGVTQYVILGSGFDTFAFRRPDLGVTVFEVDLAATIDLKKERLAGANMTCPGSLHFVPFDFEKGDLRTALVAAGLNPAKASFFNWMGVTYYLTGSVALRSLRLREGRPPDRACRGRAQPRQGVVLQLDGRYLLPHRERRSRQSGPLGDGRGAGLGSCIRLSDRGRVRAAGRPRAVRCDDGVRGEAGRAHDFALRSGRGWSRPEPSGPLGSRPQRIARGASTAVSGSANRRSTPCSHYLVPSLSEERYRRIADTALTRLKGRRERW